MLLWRFSGPAAAAIYSCAPAAFLISGFHGNSDAMCAAAMLGGVIALDRKRWFTSGALFAAAINVKLIPFAVLPIVFAALPDRRAFGRMVGGLSLAILPFVPAALSARQAMRRNLLGYVPSPEHWGLMAFLIPASQIKRLAPTFDPLRIWYSAHGSAVIMIAVIALAFVWRFRMHVPPSHGIALGIAAFLVLTPGFGIQYLIYPTLFLSFVHRRAAAVWAVTSGAFALIVYWIFLDRTTPPYQAIFTSNFPEPAPILGAVAWATLVWYMLDELIRACSPTREIVIPETSRQQRTIGVPAKLFALGTFLIPVALLFSHFGDKPINEPLRSFDQALTSSVRMLHLHPHEKASIPVTLRNPGGETWYSVGRFPILVSYKWFGSSGMLPIEGERTPLPGVVKPEGVVDVNVNVEAPPERGDFRLRITLVQEGVAWFMSMSNRFLEVPVFVE
jgi:hypothetical protein